MPERLSRTSGRRGAIVEITTRDLTADERAHLTGLLAMPLRVRYHAIGACVLGGLGAVAGALVGLALPGGLVSTAAGGLVGIELWRRSERQLARAERERVVAHAAQALRAGSVNRWQVRATSVASLSLECTASVLWLCDVGDGQLLLVGGPAFGAAVAATPWPVDEFTLEVYPHGGWAAIELGGQALDEFAKLDEADFADSQELARVMREYYDGLPLLVRPWLVPGRLATATADLAGWMPTALRAF